MDFTKSLKFLIFVVPILGLTNCANKEGGLKLLEMEISKSYYGVVQEKLATRKNMKKTHIKIKPNDHKSFLINVFPSTLDQLNIGDSVYKPKNENFIYLLENQKTTKKFNYRYLNKTTKIDLKRKYPKLLLD